MKAVCNRIFELLKQQGKTQKEFSSFTGIKESAISQWKVDNTNPKVECLPIIAEFLSVSIDYLLGADTNTFEIQKAFSKLNLDEQKSVLQNLYNQFPQLKK